MKYFNIVLECLSFIVCNGIAKLCGLVATVWESRLMVAVCYVAPPTSFEKGS
jgi:hypothetical protein